MDFRDRVFLAVAEHLSFSKAGTALRISQPAVTRHIRELEAQLEVNLFERKGPRIKLTTAGELVYSHLKPIRALYRELLFDLEQAKGDYKGSLRVGASSTIAQYVIPPVLAAFYKRYPHIDLYLFNGNSVEMESRLLANDLDVALVENAAVHPDLRYLDFASDEIVAVTAADGVYARERGLRAEDLQTIPLVLREPGSGTLEVIQQAFLQQGWDLEQLNVFLHLGSTESIKNFLPGFSGVALVSEKAIDKELRLRSLVQLPLRGFSIRRSLRVATRQGHLISPARLFVDFLTNYNL